MRVSFPKTVKMGRANSTYQTDRSLKAVLKMIWFGEKVPCCEEMAVG
jgi:hypothetical protein